MAAARTAVRDAMRAAAENIIAKVKKTSTTEGCKKRVGPEQGKSGKITLI